MRSLTVCVPFSRHSTISSHPVGEPVWLETWKRLEPQLGEGDEVILVDCNADTEFDAGRSIPFESERIRLKVLVAPKEGRNALNFLRNLGIKEAKNDPILLLEPGCIPGPEVLENARALFDPGVVYGAHVEFIEEHGGLLDDQRQNWESDVRENQSVDEHTDETSYLTGYCLLFSKERTSKLGWFTEDIDDKQGPGHHNFVEKCYHSGLQLRHEPTLRVSRRASFPFEAHKQSRIADMVIAEAPLPDLPSISPYRPEVFVLVVTMLRPYFLDECLKRIFKSMTPVKVRLVNQGDRSEEMLDALRKWTPRWAVDYFYNEHPRSMAEVRSEAFTWAKRQGYEYAVTIDDDMLIKPGALDELVKTARENPQFHAISGYCIEPDRVRLLGGREKILDGRCYRFNLPYTRGLTEVDFISSGLRIVRLEPLILQDTDYDFGWIDWDYSKRIKQADLRLAVTGEVGGYHGMMQVDGKWRLKPDPGAYASIRLDVDRMERMTQLFEDKWSLKLGRGTRPLSYRLTSRIQWGLGTMYYRGTRLYEQMRLRRDLALPGGLKTKSKDTVAHRRSRLETYMDVLGALSEGTDSTKDLSLAVEVPERELHEILREMSSKTMIRALDNDPDKERKDGNNYELTEKGMNILKYFGRMRRISPYQKA
jgi:predicted transcriptional regulator